MTKQIGILIAGAFIIILLGGALLMTRSSKTNNSPSNTNQDVAPSGQSMTKGTIAALLSAGKTVTCSVESGDAATGAKSTIFIAGKKVRIDSKIAGLDNKMMESHVIQDGDYMYVWQKGTATGTKFKIDELNKIAPTGAQYQATDLNKQVNMNCSRWSVNASVFTPPSNIDFTDMSVMMKNMREQTGNMKELQKSACDGITDPQSKAACQKAMGGNQ